MEGKLGLRHELEPARLAVLYFSGLRMHLDILLAGSVVNVNRVELHRLIALEYLGFDPGDRLVLGQLNWRHILRVVDAADNERLVGIALDESDHDFMPHTRPEESAPCRSCPDLRNANPARTGGIPLTVPIPVKLHLNTAIFVYKQLTVLWPHHRSRLHAVHYRTGSDAARPIWQLFGKTTELIGVLQRGSTVSASESGGKPR